MKAYLYEQKTHKFLDEIKINPDPKLSQENKCDYFVFPLFCTHIAPDKKNRNMIFDTAAQSWFERKRKK